MHNWAHVRVILEASNLRHEAIRKEMAAHCIYGVHGITNPQIAIYVHGPQGPTGTKIRVLRESSNKSCPWTAFEVHFAKESRFEDQQDFADSKAGQKRKEKATRKQQQTSASRKRANVPAADLPTSRGSRVEPNTGYVRRCGKTSWKVIALHTHNDASFGPVAEEALRLYEYAFENQFDIVCGDGNKHMQFHSEKHKLDRRDLIGSEHCSDIPNGIFNLLARACIAQQNRGMPFASRVNMHTIDSKIFFGQTMPGGCRLHIYPDL